MKTRASMRFSSVPGVREGRIRHDTNDYPLVYKRTDPIGSVRLFFAVQLPSCICKCFQICHGSEGQTSKCKYFWHSSIVRERVVRVRARATRSSTCSV